MRWPVPKRLRDLSLRHKILLANFLMVLVPVLLIAVLGMLLLAFAFIVWFGLSLARLLFRQVLDPLAGRATGSPSRRGRAERDGRRSSPAPTARRHDGAFVREAGLSGRRLREARARALSV